MKKLMLLGCGVLLLIGLAVGGKIVAGHLVDSKLRQVTSRVKDRADIDFQDVEFQFMGLNLVVRDVNLALPNGQKAHIDTVTVHDMDVKNKPPLHAKVDLHGLSVAVNEENFGKEYEDIKELGFDTLVADVFVDYVYDPETQYLQVNEFRADAPGIAEIETVLSLSRFDLAQVKQLELEDLVIDHLAFHYEDQSFLQKMVQMTQEDEKEIIDFLVASLREDAQRAKARGQQEAVATMEEIIAFIQTPDSIRIDVVLSSKTPLQQIMTSKKITEIIKLFKINVESAG